jgi:pyrroline-5-carboxylate reductase
MTQTSTETTLAKLSGDIVLVGAGKMGGAMLAGWIASGISPKRIVVIDPAPSADIRTQEPKGLRVNPEHTAAGEVAGLIVAIKPQMFADAVASLQPYVSLATPVLSIMAGTTLSSLAALGSKSIVRAMPNLPASIGRGMTVAVATPDVTDNQRAFAHALLAATGAVEWINDEALMDAVTAVSGSGPAYAFLLAETLAAAGVAAGLPETLANKLARETVAGSGELLNQSELDASVLRKNVTSPGGTTAAALDVLMAADGLPDLMKRAVEAAAKRSRELAK